ncbi:MAG: hypothetical protein NXH97_20815 [Rhodobacteraceae bacterium]|nr:hypothetical protein [Paracoccaceae bacterium]
MITAGDVARGTELTVREVLEIVTRGRLPPASAACLGSYMLHAHKGLQRVREMICDDIRGALHADEFDRARRLYATLRRFLSDHPEALRHAT